MFGEEAFSFKCEKSIDSKNRIIIPKETKIEEDEKITISIKTFNDANDNEEQYIRLDSYELIKQKIIEIRQRLIDKGDYIELITFDMSIIDKITDDIYASKKADKQGRITLPNELLKLYGFEKKMYCSGQYDHINIFKNEEQHKKFLKRKNND